MWSFYTFLKDGEKIGGDRRKIFSFPEDKWQQWKCLNFENPLIIHMNEILITTEWKTRWRLALSEQLLLSPPVSPLVTSQSSHLIPNPIRSDVTLCRGESYILTHFCDQTITSVWKNNISDQLLVSSWAFFFNVSSLTPTHTCNIWHFLLAEFIHD